MSVLKRNKAHPLFTAERNLKACTSWQQLKSRLSPLPLREQLKAVNLFWNQWPYRQDSALWGKPDYWETPLEFCQRSGDCEDYAITKYFTLRELGIPASQMRIVVVLETIRDIAHAVLVVFVDGDALVLDNLSNNILSHSRYRNYEARLSVNENSRWAHVKTR